MAGRSYIFGMQRRRRHIALLFLSLYLPAVAGVAFFHSHALPVPGDHQEVAAHKAEAGIISVPDAYCVVCKFISSQTIPGEPRWNSLSLAAFLLTDAPDASAARSVSMAWDGRAPPFAG